MGKNTTKVREIDKLDFEILYTKSVTMLEAEMKQ